ncbi:hypothetical protein AAG570_006554, partial [Ranatra chinensis]
GYGKCGVAVIRVSGSRSAEAVKKIGGFNVLPEPRKTHLRRLRDPISKEILDRGIIIWFPGPKSFTGEDCCEFQIHGGSAVISAVLTSLASIEHFRPAEPGEFTKRAFYAGKFNLTEIEGIADLIHSETEFQRKQAIIQMEGALGKLYDKWRGTLLGIVAHIEAYIDFGEDQQLEDNIIVDIRERLKLLQESIKNHLCDGRKGERLRDGVRTVILGAPNVGKSSLMNLLCREEAAIVSSEPGTTRDIIKTIIDISGFPVILMDTAGLREASSDIIEKEGMSRAKNIAAEADLIILVIDAHQLSQWCNIRCVSIPDSFIHYIKEYIRTIGIEDLLIQPGTMNYNLNYCNDNMQSNSLKKYVIAINKSDLITIPEEFKVLTKSYNVTCLSCKTEEGMNNFINHMSRVLQILCGSPSRENPSYTQARHRQCLSQCLYHLEKYFDLEESQVDLAANELRSALDSIGRITGHVTTEQILDVIFKDFCIGK